MSPDARLVAALPAKAAADSRFAAVAGFYTDAISAADFTAASVAAPRFAGAIF